MLEDCVKQLSEKPLQFEDWWLQPRLRRQKALERPKHGVGRPEHEGTPEPLPSRLHQPASIQCVLLGQSASVRQRSVHTSAPMHMVPSAKAVHSAPDLQARVHWWWAT
jgi:hypothetical protein